MTVRNGQVLYICDGCGDRVPTLVRKVTIYTTETIRPAYEVIESNRKHFENWCSRCVSKFDKEGRL